MLRRPFRWALCLLSLSALLPVATDAATAGTPKPPAAVEKIPGEEVRGPGSYAYGYGVGTNVRENLRKQNVDIDRDQVLEGFTAAMKGASPKMTEAQMRQALDDFGRRQIALNKATEDKQAAQNLAFLGANAKKPGVTTTKTGLQYQVLKSGKGKSPTAHSLVVVHYEGKLLDGKVFDSSYKRQLPQELRVDGVIPGWQEALQLMKKGDKWRLWVPPELGYGERGAGALIPPNAPLMFDVELIDIKEEPKTGPTHEEHKHDIERPGE